MQHQQPESETIHPAPVQATQRIVDLDILRGIALFGILVVNLYIFSNPIAILAADGGMWSEWYNQAFLFFSRVFFEGKFITLFSFLFGLGFYIFTERLKMKGLPVRRVFLRRMFLLLIIGLLHATFFWAGDILVAYSVCGMITLFFVYRQDKTIKIWMGIFAGGFLLLFTLLVVFVLWGMSIPDVAVNIKEGFLASHKEFLDLLKRGYEVYVSGSFREIMIYRREEIVFAWVGMFITPMGVPYIIAVFLLGFLVGRQGLLSNPKTLRVLLIPKRQKFVVIGLLLSFIYALSYLFLDEVMFDTWTLIQLYSIVIGAPTLMLGYCGYILHWLETGKFIPTLQKFAPVGRMALSNYILQTLISTTLFYGYGLGLTGRFAPIFILPLAIAIFILQIQLSNWYFKKFNMGPLEKLWRFGTYLGRV